jgi:hypothetical protein
LARGDQVRQGRLAVQRVEVEVEPQIAYDPATTRQQEQRVDLDQRRVKVEESVDQDRSDLSESVADVGPESSDDFNHCVGQRSPVQGSVAADDLRVIGRGLHINASGRRRHDNHIAKGRIHDNADIELGRGLHRLFDPHFAHWEASDRQAGQSARGRPQLCFVLHDADATGLAASSGRHLRLDDPWRRKAWNAGVHNISQVPLRHGQPAPRQ